MTATTLRLVGNWDAPLVYDSLREGESAVSQNSERPLFVGRTELVGSLANAISEPDRRGTYLISGYRGAGKTTLVIEAARQAAEKLEKRPAPRTLLPLVLNVSEVSASLDPATAEERPPLGIDARRLLTALLRALHNELKPAAGDHRLDRAHGLVKATYDKAASVQYSQRLRASAESAETNTRTSTRAVQTANVFKLIAAVAALASLAVAGFAVLEASTAALGVVCAALAGVAVISFGYSVKMTSETSERSVDETELLFDNSLHQIETDLKQILAELDRAEMRTVVVLEELDKVDDSEGKQLDAVIRYFKNLFTQAPALFFFLTDKQYFDVIEGKLAEGRRQGTYAVEHTFFTNRVFVCRPSLEECLRYFEAIIADDEAQRAIDVIRATQLSRSRSLAQMSMVERFFRVLLFTSRNHLFDLKRELRRYVSDDEQRRPQLVFDERTFPPRDQGLAAFHFLLEQKLNVYSFGSGREYADEILRNCLSAAFADIGADEPCPRASLRPRPEEVVDLRREDRRVIERAGTSLIDDLERGGAIATVSATTQTSPVDEGFRWRENAVASFSPVAKLEAHEDLLSARLARAIRVVEQFAPGAPLEDFASGSDAERLAADFQHEIDGINGASEPLTSEQAQHISGDVVKQLSPTLAQARALHRSALVPFGWTPEGLGSNLLVIRNGDASTPPRILLVYGPEEVQPELVGDQRALLDAGPVAAVLVVDDPQLPEKEIEALRVEWRGRLSVESDAPALVTVVPLGEGRSAEDDASTWGRRTADDLVFASLWLAHVAASELPTRAGSAWLTGESEDRAFPDVGQALGYWLDRAVDVLGAPPAAGNDAWALAHAAARLATTRPGDPVLLDLDAPVPADWPEVQEAALARLRERGQLIPAYERPPLRISGRVVLTSSAVPDDVATASINVLRRGDDPNAIRAVAEFVESALPDVARRVYEQAAERGDPESAYKILVSAESSPPEARTNLERLGERGDLVRLSAAAKAVKPRDSELGDAILAKVADLAAKKPDAA